MFSLFLYGVAQMSVVGSILHVGVCVCVFMYVCVCVCVCKYIYTYHMYKSLVIIWYEGLFRLGKN